MRVLVLLIFPVLLCGCSQDWFKPSPYPRGYATHNQIDKSPPGPEVDREQAMHKNEDPVSTQYPAEYDHNE